MRNLLEIISYKPINMHIYLLPFAYVSYTTNMTSSPIPPPNSSPPFILHISDVASQILKKKKRKMKFIKQIMYIKICSYGIGNFLLAIAMPFKGRKEWKN